MVPSGWELVQAKDICKSISVGVVIKPSQYYVSEEDGIKAFRSANVREGFINDTNWVYFSKIGHEANKKSQLETGDVLVVRTGYPGTACVVTQEFEGSNAIDIVIARPDMKRVTSEYLCAYTNSSGGKAQVLNLQGGMAQKHLNVGAYQVINVKLPPLPEQQKIAQILSTWDKAICTTERLIDNSKQQKKALMQKLLTGKKRLLDESGKLFERDWSPKHLSEIAKIKKGKALSSKDLEVGEFPVIAGGKTSPYKHSKYTHKNVITASASGAYAGFIAYHKQKIWASDCSVIEEKECSDIQFIYQYLLLNQTKIYSFQSGGAQPHIYPKDIDALKVNVPDIKEQQKIATVLINADKEIELLAQQLADLKQEKKALMQQLLTGKRRVKLDEKEVA
jgi:type I restriction enzyme S subunit